MSEQWVIADWNLPHLKLMRGERNGDRLRIDAVQEFAVPDPLTQLGQGRFLAEWLTQQSSDWQFPLEGDSPTVNLAVLLPRDRVTVRPLQVPPLPVEELPALVPLQMATQLTTRLEDLVVDFLPGETSAEGTGQTVTAAAIPVPRLQDLKNFAAALHVELVFAGMSTCSLHELHRRLEQQTSRGGLSLSSWCSRDRIETLLLHDSHLLSSGFRRRNSALPLTSKEPAAEVRRLISAAETVGAEKPSQLLLIVDQQPPESDMSDQLALIAEVSQAVSLPVLGIDLESLQDRVTFSEKSPVSQLTELQSQGFLLLGGGFLAATQAQTPQVNFVAPRRAVPPKDRRKQQLIAGAVAAVVVLGGAWWMWSTQLSNLTAEIETTQTKLAESEDFIKTRGAIRKQAASMEQYFQRSLQTSGHLQILQEVLPQQDQLLLKHWRSIPLTGKSHTRVMAGGIAKTRQHIENLAEKLDQAGMIVRSPLIRPHENTASYPFEFDLDYEIPIVEALPAKKPASRSTPVLRSTAVSVTQ